MYVKLIENKPVIQIQKVNGTKDAFIKVYINDTCGFPIEKLKVKNFNKKGKQFIIFDKTKNIPLVQDKHQYKYKENGYATYKRLYIKVLNSLGDAYIYYGKIMNAYGESDFEIKCI